MEPASRVFIFYFFHFLLPVNIIAFSTMCTKLLDNPHFDSEEVVGTWNMYYQWGVAANTQDTCPRFSLKKATKKVVDEIASNNLTNSNYDIKWREGALILNSVVDVTVATSLLLPEGELGSFRILPVFNDAEKPRYPVPAFQTVLHLSDNYLVIANCDQNRSMLMARSGQTVVDVDVIAMATSVWHEEGSWVCKRSVLMAQ